MSKLLSKMFHLERLDSHLFRGNNQPLNGRRIFGGQLISQALFAAGITCHKWSSHSLHAYFLWAGDVSKPIDYMVESFHNGRNFSNRRVVASQQGRPILHLSASFHSAENGLEYQSSMPLVFPPDKLPVLAGLEKQGVRQRSTEEMRVEIRPTSLRSVSKESTTSASKYWWIRLIDPLPDSHLEHQSALAYASDFGLIGTAREIHGIGFRDPGFFTASLDHAIWFHREIRCDDWMLYAMNSTSTAVSRGFVNGQIFSRNGVLIASVAQEGLIRVRSGQTSKR